MPLSSPASLFTLPAAPWIVGHRGAAGVATENTLEAIRVGLAQGADMIEVDLQMAADGSLVVFHDWSLERMTGLAETIEELDALRLGSVELASGSSATFQALPLLGDVLALTRDQQVPLNLELKRRASDPARFADRLFSTLLAEPESKRAVLISSFDWDLLARVRKLAPNLPVAPLSKTDPWGLLDAGQRLSAWGLHAHRRLVTSSLVERAQRQRRPVLAYTVNDPAEARDLLEIGVSGFFTDFPADLRAALEATAP